MRHRYHSDINQSQQEIPRQRYIIQVVFIASTETAITQVRLDC